VQQTIGSYSSANETTMGTAFTLRLYVSTTICTFLLHNSTAQDFSGRSSTSDLFPDDAAYDPFVLDPYHIYGAPFGGFSRSAQNRLASLPLHLPEILEYEKLK
jgi:hypothetical protein